MIQKFIEGMMRPINTSAISILGVYTILWGIWLASPFWTVFTAAQLFSTMAGTAPELAWGAVALITGAVILYGALKPSYRTLTRGALVAGWYWGIVSIFYFMGDWHNTGGITALVLCIYAGYIYLNIRINKVLREDE